MLRVVMFYLTMFAMGFYAFLSNHAGKQLNSIQIHKILFPVDLYSTYRTIVKRTEIDISFSLPFLINSAISILFMGICTKEHIQYAPSRTEKIKALTGGIYGFYSLSRRMQSFIILLIQLGCSYNRCQGFFLKQNLNQKHLLHYNFVCAEF